MSKFTEIRREGAALLHADRRTDITKLLGAFATMNTGPKNEYPTSKFVFFYLLFLQHTQFYYSEIILLFKKYLELLVWNTQNICH